MTRPMSRTTSLALLALVLVAGCAAPDPVAPQEPFATVAEQPLRWTTVNSTGTIVAKTHLGHELVDGSVGAGGVQATVNGSATGILLEGAWRAANEQVGYYAPQDLDLILLTLDAGCTWSAAGCEAEAATDQSEDNDGYYRNGNGLAGLPDSPSRLRLEGADLAEITAACGGSCAWSGFFGAKGAAADLEWFLALTVFTGGTMPTNFTALPAEWAGT